MRAAAVNQSPADQRLARLERRLAQQERALDQLQADVMALTGKIDAVLLMLAARRGQ